MTENKISFIRVATYRIEGVEVEFISTQGPIRTYKSPSDSSLYRLVNNSMIADVHPFTENDQLWLEIFPRYGGITYD